MYENHRQLKYILLWSNFGNGYLFKWKCRTELRCSFSDEKEMNNVKKLESHCKSTMLLQTIIYLPGSVGRGFNGVIT
jgi:hypothetical protein